MLRNAWGAILLAVALVAIPRLAWAGGQGVVFVHGTGDFGSASDATNNYWSSSAISTMSGGYPYLVVYYPGASCAPYDPCAWGPIVDQTVGWMAASGISSIVVVTHSDGNNPIRYLLQHPTSVSASGNVASTMTDAMVSVTAIAGDFAGTPLADQVTNTGSFLNIANAVVTFFGGSSYDVPAVVAQRQDNMATYNSNGTFGGSQGASTIDGVPTYTVAGDGVDANLFSGDAWCGGYLYSLGLQLTRCFGWGCGGCSDGFIGCNSSMYLGTNIQDDNHLSHNQSRRACHGSGGTVANIVNRYLQEAAAATAPDTTESPASQACNATVQGWSGSIWFEGCPSGASYDPSTGDYFDCLIAYGTSGGASIPASYSSTPYANSGDYYSQGYSGCVDSWRGNGYCDLCQVAKYGYDGLPGSNTGGGDCVNNGPGTSNYCSDIAWNGSYGIWDYGAYVASH